MAFKYNGVEKCKQFKKNVKVCVYGGRHGWSAWLVSNAGQKLAPVSVRPGNKPPGVAVAAAMSAARRISRRGSSRAR